MSENQDSEKDPQDQNLAPRNFCQEPSDEFLDAIEENMDDPRIAISLKAIKESEKRKGAWVPTWDARDSR